MAVNRSLPGELVRSVLKFLEDNPTPRSLMVAILIRENEWDQLAGLSVDPKHYLSCDAKKFASDYQCTSILKKYEGLPTSIDRKAAAVENFWVSERECFRTNERLSPYLFSPLRDWEDTVVGRVLLLARKKIASVLGTYPESYISDFARHGPGATFGDRGQFTTVPDKMTSSPTLTGTAIPWLFPWIETAWARACAAPPLAGAGAYRREPCFVAGNRFTTVPKDATKDRGIAVEPSINVFYQLALGRVIRSRLKSRAGLDIQRAQEVHRRVACEASIRGHLSTIDLSNASDTVCKNLVKLLLPARWYEALASLRSPKTLIEGRWQLLEKFSSMGNGYTFELETLIFWALASSAVEMQDVLPVTWENVFAYGDDIIVPSDCTEGVIAVLRFFGFTPNERKTFSSGPFRESCGGDYFNGWDVRPYFQKESLSEPQHYIAMANGLRRVALSEPRDLGRFHRYQRAWFGIIDALPSSVKRCRGPERLGDLVIHDEQPRWEVRWRNCIRYVRVWRPARWNRVGWDHFHPDVVLASALLAAGDGELGVTPRDAVAGYKLGWVPSS